MKYKNIDKVFKDVNKIVSVQLSTFVERSDKGELFNVFSLCGVNHYEFAMQLRNK